MTIVYPLKEVLEIKKRRVEDAEKVLKEKQEALAKEKEKLAQREAERDRVLKHKNDKLTQMRTEMDHDTTTAKIQQMKAYLKVAQERVNVEEKKVKEQQTQVENAQKLVDHAREELRIKQLEVDKMEMHRKDWLKLMLKEEELAEEREQDEIGNITYLLHQRSGV